MARTFHLSTADRLNNWIFKGMLRLGIAPKGTYLLTVPGRRSGMPHSTPVIVVEHGVQRWLVAPYGAVNWVRNARAAGQVTLSRGHRSESVTVVELGPEESAPILKEYVQRIRVARPYFDAVPQAPLEAFAAEAARHPVFRVQ
ncbi:MAG: nitroreductase family deazaflavin-dependent oxidoreductase [Chloroflexota bacterium]